MASVTNGQKLSRHRLCLACGGLDIFCASCYGVVKGEQSSTIALKNANEGFYAGKIC